jgi:hypothetical protein
MNPERWQRVKEILNEALDRDPETRGAFLDEKCHADKELRGEVESLLQSYGEADEFIKQARAALKSEET